MRGLERIVVFGGVFAFGDGGGHVDAAGAVEVVGAAGFGDGECEFKAGDDGREVRGAVAGAVLDAVFDDAGEGHGDARVDFVGFAELARFFFFAVGFLFRDEGGDVVVRHAPVHGGAEVEDVGGGGQRAAGDLFRGDVIGGALNALFDGAGGTGLAEVDDFDGAVFVDEDVVGFDVGMDVAEAVHGREAAGDLEEDLNEGVEAAGAVDVQGCAVD